MRVIKATGDMIYVQDLDNEPKTTESGIILGASTKPPQRYGMVISVGNDVEVIKANDVVVFHERAGQAVVMDGVIGRMLKFAETYGVLDEVVVEEVANG